MVVVMIVSILTVLAVPSLSHESWDRRAYTDAASVAGLVREARTRSVGRGAAELLVMNGESSGNNATFALWEATTAGVDAGPGASVQTTCGPPTTWPGGTSTSTATLIDAFSIANSSLESIGNGNINMQVFDPTGAAATGSLFLCFTPSGRTYYTTGAVGTAPANFQPLTGTVGAVIVQVAAGPPGVTSPMPTTYNGTSATNVVRNVWIPPSGSTSITTQ
jgi:Tfp pilus assembly protein FimT